MTAPVRVDPVRVGVVGFGLRASLARAVVDSGLGEVTTVLDPSERGRTDARRALGGDLPIAESLDALLASGVEAIMVLSPDDTHRDVAVAALRAGVPVFCEKPLAITIADCDDVLRTAYETRTRLYVGHNMRHMPRRAPDAGRDHQRPDRHRTVGLVPPLRRPRRRLLLQGLARRPAALTGLLLQKGAHDLDVIHWLAGGYTRRTSAMGQLAVYGSIGARREPGEARMTDWYDPTGWPPSALTGLNPVVDVEDLSMMLMELDNGVLASYEQCHFTPDYWRNYTVIGNAGRVENFGDGPGGGSRSGTDGRPAGRGRTTRLADRRHRGGPRRRRRGHDRRVPALRPQRRADRDVADRRPGGRGRRGARPPSRSAATARPYRCRSWTRTWSPTSRAARPDAGPCRQLVQAFQSAAYSPSAATSSS